MSEIELMQQNMLLIRRCLGWSATEFGERIGVTRQTINSLEANGNYKLSKTQYLAIRKVLDDEIKRSNEDTAMVQSLLYILIDHPEEYSEQAKRDVVLKANMMAPSVLTKTTTRLDLSRNWVQLLSSGMIAGVAAASIPFIGLFSAPGIVAGFATGFASLANAVNNQIQKPQKEEQKDGK